jgi:predicted aminopeptidase
MTVHRPLLMLTAVCLLSGCAMDYYMQAVNGHLDVVNRSHPIDELLADPATPEELGASLKLSQEILQFARGDLLLPDNGSYEVYADLERDYVVWNVFAAPEFSLEPKTWCFPVAGCVRYRGYFSEDEARAYADKLGAKGNDIRVGGARAYSTLGMFSDPLLNTMVDRGELRLASVLIHELAHQQLYVKDDTAFNEGFATAVEQEGVRRWLAQRDDPDAFARYTLSREQRGERRRLAAVAKIELQQLYESGADDAEMRVGKARILRRLEEDFGVYAAPGAVITLNNASLAAMGAYEDTVPAFQVLLHQADGDLEEFYRRAEELGDLKPEARRQALDALLNESESLTPE